MRRNGNTTHYAALLLHSLALFAILFQFRLVSGDLADTSVFAASLTAAFFSALFFARFVPPPLLSLAAAMIVPWAARLFIALPRHLGAADPLALDSLLLNLDRNYFVSTIPYYWAALGTWFACPVETRPAALPRKFLRANVLASAALLIAVYSMARTSDIELYRFPVVMIIVFTAALLLEAVSLVLSLPPEIKLRKSEAIPAAAALLVLVLLGGVLFLRPSQERAVEQGGGLLEPKLLSFDFSQFLRLETEISMKDDLVFIVKKDPQDGHILLRRFALSGYGKKQGFFRMGDVDEKIHPQKLPESRAVLADPAAIHILQPRLVDQEYYLVNFDSAAFIAMNIPVEAVPFEAWDASSFSSAYAARSLTSDVLPFELSDSLLEPPTAENLGLTGAEYALYTEYGGDERIAACAKEITSGSATYWEKVIAVYEHLKYGDYRYSLKPGIAPDGDQLSYFLYDSKKGYCSYFAFAMALLLRSQGIPARVAAGFFINPEENTFDYFPVRSNMAHAWVEIPFPGYGWVEFDPTTEQLAAGEEFQFSSGDQSQFERLMKEILDNHSRLKPKAAAEEEPPSNMAALIARARRVLLRNLPLLIAAVLALMFLFVRGGIFVQAALTRNARRTCVRLWGHAKRRLALAGVRRDHCTAEAEWAKAADVRFNGTYALYQGAAAARFAETFSDGDCRAQRAAYDAFAAAYAKTVPSRRRVLAWICPPLALLIGADGVRRTGKTLAVLAAAGILFSLGGDSRAQDTAADVPATDTIMRQAEEAENAELWERAIELYTQGKASYPLEVRFPWALGNLYFGRGLYSLAWDEYRAAETLDENDPDVLYQLSLTAGYLNRDHVSVDYLERVLAIIPDDHTAIGNLGWMYYKVHRLADGQALLLRAINRFGADSDFAMTLGTLYSDDFKYGEGKRWYLEAIDGGERAGDRVFTAVAHYNLSILETRFYKYKLAFERTNASLKAQNRASGRLARGESYLRQMDFEHAFADYEAAYELDTSPLAKLNLAQICQISGRLEMARLYAEDCLKGSDQSWMLNYGIDPVRYRRDIHEILYKTYGGLEKTEALTPAGTAAGAVKSLARRVMFRFKYEVNRKLFQKYSLAGADAYGGGAGGEHLDALTQYYNAFTDYPRRAIDYLNRARAFESGLIPQAAPSYDLEEGVLLKKIDMVRAAAETFDGEWEEDMICDAWIELAKNGEGEERRAAAEALFALNRGALRQEGITLPARLTVTAANGVPAKTAAALRKYLAASGFDAKAPSPRYSLDVTAAEGAAGAFVLDCELRDGAKNLTVLRRAVPLASTANKDLAASAAAIAAAAFTE